MKNKLTEKEIDMLWSGGGEEPYSQVNLIIQRRILNDRISRVFVIVEVEINPTTFRLVKKHRSNEEFKDNIFIQQLLDCSDYRGPAFGYVSVAFEKEYDDKEVLMEAEDVLQYAQDCVITMHQFITNNFYA